MGYGKWIQTRLTEYLRNGKTILKNKAKDNELIVEKYFCLRCGLKQFVREGGKKYTACPGCGSPDFAIVWKRERYEYIIWEAEKLTVQALLDMPMNKLRVIGDYYDVHDTKKSELVEEIIVAWNRTSF